MPTEDRCVKCDQPISDDAHQAHDDDCPRFLAGVCRCDGWVCPACCPDSACVTPLAERIRQANHQHRVAVAALPHVPVDAA